ncbi:hypothetical protein [Kribbella soli]|uniref:Mycothiol-dependent maleylpyruvate isomerase metal-binding domain-containing protein n=1 Tax=Kribbella soli TaxID=1124743 RepID=A0A4R0HKA8_9ACTN|nr:hypothetical protein [Kribbella soli]TCC10274.1 hypothetical protein E0H45_02810 [Kribbella soli]
MAFTVDDLRQLSDLTVSAWQDGIDRDWSAPAGGLTWNCLTTADHTVDTVIAPAVFLASRKLDSYPAYGIGTPGPDASPSVLVEALQTATRILVAVVREAGPDARAVIWRRPHVEIRGPADFPPRAGLELIFHAYDVCLGLGVPFDPPTDLCERLREHTRDWPMWTSPGWSSPTDDPDAWADLIRSSGRQPLPT